MIFHIFTFLEFGQLTRIYFSPRGFGLASLHQPGRSPPEISLNGKSLFASGVLFCFPSAHTDCVNSELSPPHTQELWVTFAGKRDSPHFTQCQDNTSYFFVSPYWEVGSLLVSPDREGEAPWGPDLGGVSHQMPHLGWLCPF